MPDVSRLLLLTIVCFVALSGCAKSGADADLSTELIELGRADQEVRARWIAAVDLNEPNAFLETEEAREIWAEMAAVDERNQLRLDEIVVQHGWPDERSVGAEAASAALLIIEHSSLETKERYLPLLRKAVADRQTDPSLLAELEDEVSVATTGYQIYGTEISLDTGVPVLVPIVDLAELDARRAEMGLPPMEEYLNDADALAIAQFGVAIDQSALRAE